MKKFLLAFILINCIQLQAQKMTIDYKVLEQEVVQLMNEHRATLSLNSLENDVVLQKAAQDQSDYMVAIRKLTHEQANKNKTLPKNRIQYFGGKDFNAYGENVLYITLEPKSYSKTEISEIAKTIYEDWANSAPHYKNIVDSRFKYANVAFAYDVKSKRLYATTVFGNKLNE